MLDPETIMARVQPPIPRGMRIALVESGLAGSHKEAQELYVMPYLAQLALQTAE